MRRISQAAVLTITASALSLGAAGTALAGNGASAEGAAVGSPGVISGNTAQIPIHIPINLCGNTIDVVGLLNPSMGNICVSK